MHAGLTDDGIFSMEYTEHIDLMPTLAELAMNATVPACPDDETILYELAKKAIIKEYFTPELVCLLRTTQLCTMGKSLVPMMTSPRKAVRRLVLDPAFWPIHLHC